MYFSILRRFSALIIRFPMSLQVQTIGQVSLSYWYHSALLMQNKDKVHRGAFGYLF